MRRAVLIFGWVAASAGASVYLAMTMRGHSRTLFLPGTTTAGHHQIQQKCELCHDPGGNQVREQSCLGCHEHELSLADDSHPRTKFLDPRNAHLLRSLDARRCVACHIEHRPSVTGPMGVSQPVGFCRTCHEDIAEERPSHRGFPFAGCDAVGCHNYHDNRALSEQFLADHLDEPALRPSGTVAALDREVRFRGMRKRAIGRQQEDAPRTLTPSETVLAEWEATAHAIAGVNCTACHGGAAVAGPASATSEWVDRPGPQACRSCHPDEVNGFLGGKHGMRRAADLGPMRPSRARLPMHEGTGDRELGCTSCHGAHSFDRRRAAVEACLECHADEHSKAYVGSPHHERWKLEQSGAIPAGGGVSCATCHLPRVRKIDTDRPGIAVEHDQNDVLRPVETMVRPVCQGCHGVDYALSALSDRALVRRNFRGPPSGVSRSVDMVRAKRAASSGVEGERR